MAVKWITAVPSRGYNKRIIMMIVVGMAVIGCGDLRQTSLWPKAKGLGRPHETRPASNEENHGGNDEQNKW